MQKVPTEYEECKVFAQWLRLQNLLFCHIPNETYTPYWGVKMKNKMINGSPGVPDYMVCLPNGKGLLLIEMKRKKGGVVSEVQEKWIGELNKISHVQANVCRGAEEAISTVERVLKTAL
jgi:hypothetical protein